MVESECRTCHVCGTRHYNACPWLWGGDPERPVPAMDGRPDEDTSILPNLAVQ
ncbi:hypothetical protein SAMN04489765_0141 [Tsukamurella pulmonis]|uniref:Uncharacterized protein n=1 Tax=Tsukamurella pulmonis TaxID=47312 RepID=A0A1H1ABK4_9ACTN|nr:hypothetical protein SAMN04489765_0141 [Tsukamurella pulmonis]SUQ39396.1 Uncharacterised protein [Tsukamurella pulmonis]